MNIMPFQIPLWAELIAVGLGGLQGAMFAAQERRRIDLLGVALIGIGVALGGSLARDILLNELPVVIRSSWYLLVAVAAALLGMALQRLFARLNAVIVVLDAVTIGLFGAIGTSKALALGVPEVPAVFVGVIAAVGGSIIRDVSLAHPVALMQVGSLYAIAAAVGAALLVLLVSFGVSIMIAAIASVVLTSAIRLGSVQFGWTIPEQRAIGRARGTSA